MSKPIQNVAALVIFGGYGLSPCVSPDPEYGMLACPRVVPAFSRLAAYMARYKELVAMGDAWQPFEFFAANGELLGAALTPWLRGGARYLAAHMETIGIALPEPETVPPRDWYKHLPTVAYAFHKGVEDEAATRLAAQTVWQAWEPYGSEAGVVRKAYLESYYTDASEIWGHLGLEADPQRILKMRKKSHLYIAV